MSLKLENGVYPLDERGLPVEITDPLEELTQLAALSLNLPLGALPMAPELGTPLGALDRSLEHADRQAVSLAAEALGDLPGVTVQGAQLLPAGVRFTLETPYGETEVLYGNDQ